MSWYKELMKKVPPTAPVILQPTAGWVIDKRISLPTLVTLAAYLVMMVWMASKFDSRLTAVEVVASANTIKIEQTQNNYSQVLIRLATIDERLANIARALKITPLDIH